MKTVILLLFAAIFVQDAATQIASPESLQINLDAGWALQSSAKVASTGEEISITGYSTRDWIDADVPTTVVGAQVEKKLLPDPFFGMNLRQYPGVSYPIGGNFSKLPMPKESPYAVSWWYRKEFSLPPEIADKTVWLNFGGINYRANIFLNGKKIANEHEVAGAWRTYEFNVTRAIKPGPNALAVQVWAPTEHDLAITFVDWNPMPPDKDMGLFRDVYLTSSGPVAIRHAAVSSKVDSPANDLARLTVTALVNNGSNHAVRGSLKGKIENIEFAQPVELVAGESKDVTFTPQQFQQLNLSHPRLWWPAQMGEPNLYDLTLTFEREGAASDVSRTKFGIREITSEVSEYAPGLYKRLFKINGKNILIRGGGWTPDMLLREDHQRM
ncbi:MAG TPA: beta galactosidase jelly roll domain-containing protein, partial [Terriglobales bacterium]|nr:beta galactosidase jelly roll domain-containing protein [Terriglobales bacterium]